MMIRNPKIYEINTRVWIKNFGNNPSLNDIPLDYFKDLAEKGINYIWLMGIWKGCPSLVEECCFGVDLVSAYNKSLKDWSREDVIGSPFAIDDYVINPKLGSKNDLLKLKDNLNKLGLKLILDFVPNHFCANTSLIKSNPEIFLETDEECLNRDSFTCFKRDDGRIFVHGRDPLFPAWTDTIQINYFNPAARDFMTEKLLNISELCDGVRCDMAILPLNNIFHNTWIGILNKTKFKKPKDEFWKIALKEVKNKNEDFMFIGEAYWDLEWDLQQLGFDFTYDKKFLDRLASDDISGVKAHLTADDDYQLKSVRFLENHDEARTLQKFGEQKSNAAAVIMNTVQGAKLYYDGQFEGKRIKLPVQLGKAPNEKSSKEIKKFYEKLLAITKDNIFNTGSWMQLYPFSAGGNNQSFSNFFAWMWNDGSEFRIVITNYSNDTSQCRIKISIDTDKSEIKLLDLFTKEVYTRKVFEMKSDGLFIELKAYASHIFSFSLND